MEDMFSRTRMLLGDEAMDRLGRARVAVFGIGGVGGHAVEALARSGVGALDLIDSDRVVLSNLNRQIVATRDTLGMLKVEAAKAAGTPIISSMGAGNKLDPTVFRVADIAETSVCPLARVMRRELRKRGIDHVKVVYSAEPALSPAPTDEETHRRATPGSVAFVPSVAGLILAGEVIKDIIKIRTFS